MKATEEQTEIVKHQGNLVIEALAGTGKTTVLIEKAKANPNKTKLYIAYNKATQIEGEQKCKEAGVEKIKVVTAHGLAYKNIGYKYKMVEYGNYKVNDILDLFKLSYNDNDDILLATYILRLYNFYANSAYESVGEVPFAETWLEREGTGSATEFIQTHEDRLISYLQKFWTKMDSGEIPIDHNFYLKKYQLSNPVLNEEMIFGDEFQDASNVILDIVLKQKGNKIIVGDENQSLYRWRYAINALAQVDYDRLYLTGSFRFGKNIEKIAAKVLQFKEKYLKKPKPLKEIQGLGPKPLSNYAILCRTNAGVLDSAIQSVFFGKQKVSYEGNISSYMFASDTSNIYDVLNFYCNKRQFIRNKLFSSFKSWEDLKKYVKDADDKELEVQCNIVQRHGGQLYTYLKELKNKEHQKKDSDVTISTVHKSKGQEYGHVTLGSDFKDEEWFGILTGKGSRKNIPNSELGFIEEEININYVAVTRAASNIEIPEGFFADNDKLTKPMESFTNEEKEAWSVQSAS
jgi:superfamily I DNA/RNA helicase